MEIKERAIKQFRIDFAKAMKSLEEEYGVKVEIGNISYNSAGFHSRLEVKNLTASGELAVDPIHEAKAKRAMGSALTPVIGHWYELANGNVVEIHDYDSKKIKYPFLYTFEGKSFKCSRNFIGRFVK
jgi:hypothetical protein